MSDFPATGRLAGIDYGTVRIGVAISDPGRTIASPYRELHAPRRSTRCPVLSETGRATRMWSDSSSVCRCTRVVRRARSPTEVRPFAAWLAHVTDRPTCFYDERFTTREATYLLGRRTIDQETQAAWRRSSGRCSSRINRDATHPSSLVHARARARPSAPLIEHPRRPALLDPTVQASRRYSRTPSRPGERGNYGCLAAPVSIRYNIAVGETIYPKGRRPMRKTVQTWFACWWWWMFLAAASGDVRGAGVGESKSFHGPVGLQLYSLRDQFKERGVAPMLDQVAKWGFKYVEVAGTYGMSTADFKAELDKRGLVPIGSHFPYDRLRDDIAGVIREAKELGLIYVGCAWIGHQAPFDEKQCRAAAAVFNARRQGAGRARHEVLLPQSRLRVLSARVRDALRSADGRDRSAVRLLPDGRAVDRVPRPGSGQAAAKSIPTAGCCCT